LSKIAGEDMDNLTPEEQEAVRVKMEELDKKEIGMLSNLEKRAPEEDYDEYDEDEDSDNEVKKEAVSEEEEAPKAKVVALSKEKIKKLKKENGVSILDMLQNS
jgi:hypothetical protein